MIKVPATLAEKRPVTFHASGLERSRCGSGMGMALVVAGASEVHSSPSRAFRLLLHFHSAHPPYSHRPSISPMRYRVPSLSLTIGQRVRSGGRVTLPRPFTLTSQCRGPVGMVGVAFASRPRKTLRETFRQIHKGENIKTCFKGIVMFRHQHYEGWTSSVYYIQQRISNITFNYFTLIQRYS